MIKAHKKKNRIGLIGKLEFFLHVLILLMFCWRSLFEFFHVHQFVYVFLAVAIVVNLLGGRFQHKRNTASWMYFGWGMLLIVLFFPEKGLLLSGMGFAALYLTFLIWILSPLTSLRDDKWYDIYIMIFVGVMVVNAFISMYQFFVEASFFGLITSVSGDESVMGLDNVTRRTVGFMGSPQSFSAASGVSLFVASTLRDKRIRILSVGIIMIGGLFSGSRAFGVFLVFFLLYLFNNQNTKIKLVVTIFVILFSVIWGALLINMFMGNDTLARNFAVQNWAAKSIYFTQFEDFGLFDYLFGRGCGLEGWNVQSGNLSFDYSSTESAFLSVVYQLGIIGGVLFLLSYIKIYLNSHRTLFCKCLMIPMLINLCLTPAFAGFAYSYIAWGVLYMLNNRKMGVKQ